MDKLTKHDFERTIEQYLGDNQVYELVEDLIKQLLVARPSDPLDFLIEQLSKNKRKFVVCRRF